MKKLFRRKQGGNNPAKKSGSGSHPSPPSFSSISGTAAAHATPNDPLDPSNRDRINTNAHNAGHSSSGFFAYAGNTDARYGTFTENINNINITTSEKRSSDNKEELAKLKPADRAGYHVPRCMDGTRQFILEEVNTWLDDLDEPNILWLSGGPGAGKSAIASSMVYSLSLHRRLGSSFFFRRGDVSLSDPAILWRTVASDLATRDPNFANAVIEALKEGQVDLQWPEIELHFNFLVEEPLRKCHQNSIPPVIVIDALDECGSDHSQRAQRDAFFKTLVHWSRFPKAFKLIVTGRDDRVPDSLRAACKQIVIPTGGDVSDDANNDIRLFFEKRFADLGGSLFPEWPGERIIKDLTARAAGLFIWAETIMRLLEQGLPDEQLDLILQGYLGDGDHLTALYRQVLILSFRSLKGRTLEVYKLVVSAVVLARTPFRCDDLPGFLSQPRPSVRFILDKLSSVISIGVTDKRIQIGHLSFTEFLCDPKRCPVEFLIDKEKESQKLAMACFERMKERLTFNICNLDTSHLFNDEVENLAERIKAKIPGSLSYSCRFWVAHLQDTPSTQAGYELLAEVRDFFYTRLLFWLEVMSLVGEVVTANATVVTAIPWIEKLDAPLSAFARDANRFIINFSIPISYSAPHIYLSALPFSPSNSLVAKHYQPLFPNTLSVAYGADKDWPAIASLCRGHTHHVNSVAFSPDGKRVVSGSYDKTIYIWDVETGQITAGPLEGHTDSVTSVAFSPDGKRLISGSHDKTLRVWDVENGYVTMGLFEGHTDYVLCVAFSPDGRQVVSSSSDESIRIWDLETGRTTGGPLGAHINWVASVVFSPDGKQVVSSSFDKTICIWDVKTGQIAVGPIEGHAACISSVAFSPDGKRLISGSYDKTLRLWDVENGYVAASLFEGHTDYVLSVAVSPDGRLVVSSSNDLTILIWDIETRQVIAGPFEGHTCAVTSVKFSPDGKQVVSGSDDKTVRIWDVEPGQIAITRFIGHTASILSVAFSPDGKQIVSGSDDKTICVWDVETGQVTAGPIEGHTSWVQSVAFSPDGKRVVSGSGDKTLYVWDVKTGKATAGPFKDHTSRVQSVAFSPDGKQIVSGSDDKTIRIWDVETGKVTAGPFKGHTSWVESAAFSPDGKHIVSGSEDKTICVWDIKTGQLVIGPLDGHSERVRSVTFSPGGKQIASGSSDNTILIWDVETGRVKTGPFKGHADLVMSVAFSPDGKQVVSSSADQTICIWDVVTGQITAGPFRGHTHYVGSSSFSPDGRQVVSCSHDQTIRVWNIESRQGLAGFLQAYPITSSDYLTNGWLMRPDLIDQQRLFWVPDHFHSGLWNTQTHCIIARHVIKLDLHHFVHGTSWTKCIFS